MQGLVLQLTRAGFLLMLWLFIWSVLVPRREMVNPGPVQSHKDGHMEAAE